MKIEVNGETQTIEDNTTVTALLKSNGVNVPAMVSVQLNGSILQSVEFESREVKEGDALEFLYFVGGGAA